jgi:hypothetical protein
LNGVSAARRILPKPACASSFRSRASGTWLPSAGLPWDRALGTQTSVDAE